MSNDPSSEPRAVRQPEAARRLSISLRLLQKLIHDGKIRVVRIGTAVLIPVQEIDDYLRREMAANEQQTEATAPTA